jgi:hypothetical protein
VGRCHPILSETAPAQGEHFGDHQLEFDTTESILEAIDVIKNDIKPFCLSVLVLTPHTNSQMEHIERLIVDQDPTHYDSQHLVWKHPHLSPEDLYELVSLAHIETLHPRNIFKKRIIDRMKAIEAGSPPLFSEGVNAIYREQRNRPGRPVPGPGHPDSSALA